jgi:hypothetical protein
MDTIRTGRLAEAVGASFAMPALAAFLERDRRDQKRDERVGPPPAEQAFAPSPTSRPTER